MSFLIHLGLGLTLTCCLHSPMVRAWGDVVDVTLFCPTNYMDPTVRDIIDTVIPWKELHMEDFSLLKGLSALVTTDNSTRDLMVSWGNSFLSAQPSFLTWLTSGRYSIRFDEHIAPNLSFMDIHILQENHIRLNPFCSLALPTGIPVISRLCHCDSAAQLQNSPWKAFLSQNDIAKMGSWGLRTASCTSRDLDSGRCDVTVDPLLRSCLLVTHTATTSNRNNKTNSHNQKNNFVDLFSFNAHIPNMKVVLPTNWLRTACTEDEKTAKEFIAMLLSFIPFYFFNFLLGLFVLVHASDLAEHKVFQAMLQLFVGVFFGLFLLIFFGNR
jgi:hypothetical protein